MGFVMEWLLPYNKHNGFSQLYIEMKHQKKLQKIVRFHNHKYHKYDHKHNHKHKHKHNHKHNHKRNHKLNHKHNRKHNHNTFAFDATNLDLEITVGLLK